MFLVPVSFFLQWMKYLTLLKHRTPETPKLFLDWLTLPCHLHLQTRHSFLCQIQQQFQGCIYTQMGTVKPQHFIPSWLDITQFLSQNHVLNVNGVKDSSSAQGQEGAHTAQIFQISPDESGMLGRLCKSSFNFLIMTVTKMGFNLRYEAFVDCSTWDFEWQ